MDDDVFSGYGVEIKLKSPEDFMKIKETLTRIGVESRKDKTLYQSCHILHKRDRYAIVHFKELFMLDGRASDISDNDCARRNRIAQLLEQWGLLDIVDFGNDDFDTVDSAQIKVIPFRTKGDWNLVSKYSIGNG